MFNNRYSPSSDTRRVSERQSSAGASVVAEPPAAARVPEPVEEPSPPREPPEVYRPGDWLTAVEPRKAPYHPQMGDECLYFRRVRYI